MEEKIDENNIGKIDISGVVSDMRKEQDDIKDEKKKTINPFSFLNINKGTADRIQTEADESQVSKLLNHLIFDLTPCKNRKLTEAEVQQINPGGGIVASIMVAMPNLPLNHPFLILGIRLVTLYLKVKIVCNKITEGVQTLKDKLGGVQDEGFSMIKHE